MTSMTSAEVVVTGGVDTHQDEHVAAALDHLGRVLGTQSFPTILSGYRQLHRWLSSFGNLGPVGIEGTGSYGAALARFLGQQHVQVIEVVRPNRQVRRRYGKTDVIDAIAAARAVQSGEATGQPKTHDGPVEALRVLKAVQRSGNKARTQALNQIHQLLVTAPEQLRAQLDGLKRADLLATCSVFRVRADDDSLPTMTRLALRELAQRVTHLDAQLAAVTARLARITLAVAPDLMAIKGVGPDVASTLLVTAGDNPDRLSHEAAFAALCGSNPIPASSGKTTRHRLNRGGDRHANAALWRVVLVRMSCDNAPATTSNDAPQKAKASPRSCAASSDTSPARSTSPYRQQSRLDSRSITYLTGSLIRDNAPMSLSVRAAQISDLPAVLALVRGMFVDLGTPDFHPSWAKDVTDALRDRMGRDVAASVAVDGTNIIAVAVGLVEQRLPSPRRPSGRIGYIEWLASDPRHRRRGAARLAMEDLLAWFEAQEVRLVDVHASAAARTLYEQFGFEPPTASALRWRG